MNEIFNYELIHTPSLVITFGSIIVLLLILSGTYVLLKMLSILLRRSMRNRSVPEGRQTSFLQLVSYFVWMLGAVIGLQTLGIDITFLVASSAAIMVGIGLGLQNVFKDIVSGIIILMDGTVKAGDVVEIGGWVVKVQDVSLRTSSVINRDDNIVIIPNHKFIEENVINWSHNTTPTRFAINIGVDYASDIRLVEKVLFECSTEQEDLLQSDPYRPFVRFLNFGSSSLDFQLVFWSNNMFRIESTKSQLRFAIIEAFNKNAITIPFSQVMVHQAVSANPE